MSSESMASPAELEALKAEILALTRRYAASAHRAFRPAGDPLRPSFDAKGGSIPYAGRVFTEDEVEAAVSSTLDFWLTLGNEGEAFQKELAGFLGVRACLAVNSGSSANLLALSALTSPLLPATKRLQLPQRASHAQWTERRRGALKPHVDVRARPHSLLY